MKIVVLFFMLMIGLTACQWGKPPKKEQHAVFNDTLVYTYKTIRERAADCGSKPDSACTVVKMNYPEFIGNTILNDTIEKKAAEIFSVSEKRDINFNNLAKHFLDAYAEDVAPVNKTGIIYRLSLNIRVIQQDSGFVSLQIDGNTFQGGAHGAAYTGFINWNTKANKEVVLKDILNDGYEAQLTKIAEGIFRKEEKLDDTSTYIRDYFFKGNKFALNNNYSITPIGLRYMYNQYEIKPYAAGQTELFIPYNNIKTLLRPQSVVTQFIHKNAGI